MEQRVVLITGAASGIGAECARVFANDAYRVVALDINESGLELLEAEIPSCLALTVDVTDAERVSLAIAESVHEFGQLNVVINNAGYVPNSPIDQTSQDDWNRCIAVNLTSQFIVSRAAMSQLKQGENSSIVNIASSSGKRAAANTGGYAAAKHGVIGLTRGMAVDLAPYGIRVNAVCPARVDTPLSRRHKARIANETGVSESAIQAQWEREIPLGRLATTNEIAGVVRFLTSTESSYVTGESWNVAGGLITH